MKTRKLALAALVAASALTFASCSSAPVPAPTEPPAASAVVDSPPVESGPNDVMPEVFEQGDFYFVSAENVVGKFTIPGAPVARLEALRKDVDAPPVSYLEVKLDARQATQGASMYSLTLFDPAGKKYVFESGETALDEWQSGVDYEESPELYSKLTEAYNSEPSFIEIGEVGTIVMTSSATSLPTEISRIGVYASGGFDEAEAYPVEMGQGLNLDF